MKLEFENIVMKHFGSKTLVKKYAS